MIRTLLIILFPLLITHTLCAQSAFIEGKLATSGKQEPIPNVSVSIKNQADTTEKRLVVTDANGHFAISDLRHNKTYLLEAVHIGYHTIRKTVTTDKAYIDLGTLAMSDTTIPMHEVVIEGRIPAVEQKGDTTEYTAQAYKTNPDASAEDLVTKMPGVTVESGNVKAQGEEVKQVLVDGRQFFGTDPTLALRNLPAEVVEKVQVFDKLSDQAQLTGFDDGQTIKTMNIVTREDRRQGEFGRLNAGYGTDDRYVATGNLNVFRAEHRLSLIGLTNNINQQNFAMQDLLGVTGDGDARRGGGGGMFGGGGRQGGGQGGGRRDGGGRMPGGGGRSGGNFMVGEQSGISTAHSLGLNYSGNVTQKMEVTGSYFFNLTDNSDPRILNRQYVMTEDSSTFYDENSNTDQTNYNHRFNLRMESEIDSFNSVIITPRLYLQNNKSVSSSGALNTTQTGTLLNESLNDNHTSTNGYTFQGNLVYRHRFQERGRTASIDIGLGNNLKKSDRSKSSLDTYYDELSSITDTTYQKSDIRADNYSFSTNIMYTEPITTSGLLQINYEYSYTKNKSNNYTYDYSEFLGDYSELNELLSNIYKNEYTTQNAGLGYRVRSEELNATARISYQIADLKGIQSYPLSYALSRKFYSFLPDAMINYEFSRGSNMRVFYRTSTNSPSITQLQNVVDNTNTLLLSTGNPDLRQSYSHTAQTRLMLSNTETARSLLLFFNVSYTKDYIGTSTLIARRDTVVRGNIVLNQGTQLSYPVNLDDNWNIRTLVTYGFPFDLIKSNLNLNMGLTYNKTPGLINGILNRADVYGLSPGIVIGSNITENLDFTISYTANFNISKNTIQKDLNNNYYTHNAGMRFNWIFWQGIVIRNEMSNRLYSGLGEDLDQNILNWNFSIGKKLFTNDRGELTLTIFDILNQNKSIRRNVTESYIEDIRSRTLTRYLLLTFSYNLRQFQAPRRQG
jgi:hypothetical protein